MIALVHSEKQALLEILPEQCLKSSSDLEFLSNLYGFDMSLCLLPSKESSAHASHITEIVMEKLDAINSVSRVPELIVWMQSLVCPIIIVPFILNDFHYTSIETP